MTYKFRRLAYSFSILLVGLGCFGVTAVGESFEEKDFYSQSARKIQNWSYQLMAKTLWDPIMSGFRPARVKAMEYLEVAPSDKVLFIGEGSGLDFEIIPGILEKKNIWGIDYSSAMVDEAKKKALLAGIPQEQCTQGDAQNLPFESDTFNKIFFPLSLGSIPNPALALQEAERVLCKKGKIVLLEKLVDDEASVSCVRRFINFFTRFIFADINRNLSDMMGKNSGLKIVHYESMKGHLKGFMAGSISSYYRMATLVRKVDYPDLESMSATLETQKNL